MSDLTYPIATARLQLRPLGPGDVDALHAYHSLESVTRYQFWSPRSTKELAEKIAEWAANENIVLGVVLAEAGRLIGDVVLSFKDRAARQGEIGYSFNPDATGQGYASEAVTALVDIGFAHAGLHRIYGRCDARNTPSWRLLERLGFRREAHFREHALFKGEWDEEFYYAMLEDEWRQRKGQGAQ